MLRPYEKTYYERMNMTTEPQLDDTLARQILAYLNVEAAPPSLEALDALLNAYVRRVPWESASRIAKRARTVRMEDCPRFPVEFWESALQHGTGGTCFESNYAFFSLLQWLGYAGYRTINNMNEKIGCHTAIVVRFDDGSHYLVDAGLPLHLPIPLDTHQRTERDTAFHTYSATPLDSGQFLIERDRHSRPYCFNLVDDPADEAVYRAATTNDYGAGGLFLDRVIVVKVIDGQIWRFSGEGAPYHLETFHNGDKTYYLLGEEPASATAQLARKFDMDETIVRAALEVCP